MRAYTGWVTGLAGHCSNAQALNPAIQSGLYPGFVSLKLQFPNCNWFSEHYGDANPFRKDLSRRWALILLVALVISVFARIISTYYIFNDVIDENLHVKAGLEYLEYGTYTLEAKHPPVARAVLAALPYFVGGLRLPRHKKFLDWLWTGSEPGYYWKTLSLARAGNLLFGLVLLVFTYCWGARLGNRKVGLAACLLVSCSPSVLGHSGLATLDVAAAATMMGAAYYYWRWCEEPGWRVCLIASLWTALAWTTKFSTVVFLPPIALAFVTIGCCRRLAGGCRCVEGQSTRTRLTQGACFALVLAGLVWSAYIFDVGFVAPPPGIEAGSGRSLGFSLANMLFTQRLPAPQFWQGLLEVLRHNEGGDGWKYYLLGEVSQRGWWYYFPLAILVKSTLPFLALFIISLTALGVVRPIPTRPQILFPLASFLVILAVVMLSNINLGIRHILGVYPLMAIVVAAVCFSSRGLVHKGRWQGSVIVVLLAWHITESLIAHPDYLAYFNEIARGKEQEFLADSNLDWGQDLARLGRYMKAEKIKTVDLHCFCYPNPELFGIATSANSGRPAEIAAVSTHLLLGLGEHDDPSIDHFRKMAPFGRVGKSIWLFHSKPPGQLGKRVSLSEN